MPKKYRLKLRWLIQKILRKGKKIHTPFFVCKYLPSSHECSQFCIVVSAKIDKGAVKRNKIRRRLTEAIRHNVLDTAPAFSVVLLVHKSIAEATYQDIEKEIQSLFSRLLQSK